MKTLYINITGEIIKSTEDIFVIGSERDALINKCCYELGKEIIGEVFVLGVGNITKQCLVTNYGDFDSEGYTNIITQLEILRYKILSKHPTGNYEVKLPLQYVDWLSKNTHPVYNCIAEQLRLKSNIVTLSVDNVYKRLLTDILKYGSNGCSQFVVNDNAVTDDSAITISIQSKLGGIAFLPFEEWPLDYNLRDLGVSSTMRREKSACDDVQKASVVDKEVNYKIGKDFVVQDKSTTKIKDSTYICDQYVTFDENNYKSGDFTIIQHANGNQSFNISGFNIEMVKVEGGEFQMGGTEEQNGDASMAEKPIQTVKVNGFYISETVITQELWAMVMGNHRSQFKGANRPVTNVSYYDCMTFIERLNKITGKDFRLPTEEEWEYAARGGNNKSIFKYSGSSKLDEVAWYSVNANKVTHDVKMKRPNALGIYDMSGNVWEWCSSHFHKYGEVQREGLLMITRGGCATSMPNACRTSRRYYSNPSHSSCYLGFRLVMLA